MQVELDSCAIRFISVASVMAPHLSAFNLGGTISKAREQAELQARSNLPYTSCNPLASSTDRRRAMSTLSAWAFGSVACSAAAKADQGGTLDSFSQSSARVGSTLGQQDGSAAGDASGSAAPNAGESPRSFKAEASPAAQNSEPAACVFDPVDLFNVDYAAASYRDHNDRC